MTLPVTGLTASTAYASLRNTAAVLYSHATQLQASLAANSVLPSLALNLLRDCTSTLTQIAAIEANAPILTSVLALYASDTGDTTDTTATKINASATALQALVAAILADFPKAADGVHLSYETFGAGGVVAMDTFTAAQFPTTPNALSNWVATVS